MSVLMQDNYDPEKWWKTKMCYDAHLSIMCHVAVIQALYDKADYT